METVCGTTNNKPLFLKAFNNQFTEMLNDIESVIPNNIDVITAKKNLVKIKLVNPKLVVKSWYEWVTCKYQKEIESGDYNFFINKDYNNSGDVYDSTILEAIERMRSTVSNLDEQDKKIVLSYVKNLCDLSKLYME
tara:strand:- start:3102 stop:3509 length:408 start_codon:yes stop_codon:yes gene_type:complete